MTDRNHTQLPPLMTGPEFAKFLGISKASFYRWKREGFIPDGVQYGPNTTRWPRHLVEQWMAEKEGVSLSAQQ